VLSGVVYMTKSRGPRTEPRGTPQEEICSEEIPTEFEVIAGQGHPRSLILVLIESAYHFLLVINSNFGRISYRFEILT